MMRTLVLLTALATAGGFAHAQDFDSWNEVDFAATWRKVNLLAPVLARTDSSLPNPQMAATGLMADFPVRTHWTLTGGYLFADLPQKSLLVHVPLIAVTGSLRAGHVMLADRNRFEKLCQYANSPIRYRNRGLIDLLIGAQGRGHLFVEDEVLYNLTDTAWNQNQLQSGGGMRLDWGLFLDLYYLRRNAAGGAAPSNVLGTTLRISLPCRHHGT